MYETSIKATIVNENKMKMTMFNVQYVERKCEKKTRKYRFRLQKGVKSENGYYF